MNARLVDTLFSHYLCLRRFEVDGAETDVLSGPGHDVVVVTCVVRQAGGYAFVVKQGDTRPARALRGWTYVREGLVAGRLDHEGSPPEVIARGEVEEEVGGVVAGQPVELGELPVPTMPVLSTEADLYVVAGVRFAPGARPKGDGGGMEVPDLLGFSARDPETIFQRIREGSFGEACRARVAFGRAFEKLGLVPAVPALAPADWGAATTSRGSKGAASRPSGTEAETLGLGPVIDPARLFFETSEERSSEGTSHRAEDDREQGIGEAGPPSPPGSSPIDGAVLEIRQEIPLKRPPGRFVATEARHAARGEPVGPPFPVQILDAAFDEVEVVPYQLDPSGVPWVLLERVELPALKVKSGLASEVRSGRATPVALWSGLVAFADPDEVDGVAADLAWWQGLDAPERLLRSEASPGQSTLGEHAFAARAPLGLPGAVRIDEAILRLRTEGGSARTEALLLELAGRTSRI